MSQRQGRHLLQIWPSAVCLFVLAASQLQDVLQQLVACKPGIAQQQASSEEDDKQGKAGAVLGTVKLRWIAASCLPPFVCTSKVCSCHACDTGHCLLPLWHIYG